MESFVCWLFVQFLLLEWKQGHISEGVLWGIDASDVVEWAHETT